MRIREYTANDRQACIEIFKSNMPMFFARSELPQFENWLRGRDKNMPAYKNNDEEYYFVAEQYNRIIGCGGFYVSIKDKKVNLCWGMIDSDLHHRGFGRFFMRYRLAFIEKIHPGFSIVLDTTQFSYQFFEKLGFKVTRITKNHYAEGLDRYDMIKLNYKWLKRA